MMRVIAELGPWLWMLSSFVLMTIEIFSGRGIALSLAFGAMIAGTVAVFGANGIWVQTSDVVQGLILVGSALAIFTMLKMRPA